LWALGSIGDNSAVPVVLEFAKNQEPSIRKVAAYIAGSLKDPRAVEDLRALLNDPKMDVTWYAAMGLAQLNDPSGADLLMKLTEFDHVNPLTDMTEEQKAELRINAVKALAILKYEPAKERLKAMSQNDPVIPVRKAAFEALEKF